MLKKFVFEDSVESNIVEMHKKIEAGQIEMQNIFVPNDAVKVLTRNWNGVDKALLLYNHTKKLVETIKQLTLLWAKEEQLMGNQVYCKVFFQKSP